MRVTGMAKAAQVADGIPAFAPRDDSAASEPLIMRILLRPAAYRQPKAWGRVCLAVSLWLFILGVILCSYGFWWGAALIAVGAWNFGSPTGCSLLRCRSGFVIWSSPGPTWWTTRPRSCAGSSGTFTTARRRNWLLSP